MSYLTWRRNTTHYANWGIFYFFCNLGYDATGQSRDYKRSNPRIFVNKFVIMADGNEVQRRALVRPDWWSPCPRGWCSWGYHSCTWDKPCDNCNDKIHCWNLERKRRNKGPNADTYDAQRR